MGQNYPHGGPPWGYYMRLGVIFGAFWGDLSLMRVLPGVIICELGWFGVHFRVIIDDDGAP